MDNTLKITLLGTGTPVPLIDRMGCSVLIQAADQNVLIDCGRGAAQRINQTDTPLKDVFTILLTHLHYDHYIGVPDLWLTGWLYGRKIPVTVYGPPGTKSMIHNLAKTFEVDVHIRRDLDEKFDPEGAKILGNNVGPGFSYEKSGLRIESFEVDHHPVPDAMGYIITYKEKKVIISGDTRYMPSMSQISKGADLLIHEVAAPEAIWKRSNMIGRDPEHTQKIIDHHATPSQVGSIFKQSEVKLGAYYHIVGGPGAEEEVSKATKEVFEGNFLIPEDLTVIEIGDEIKIS
ncbi:MAG: MBL fold metallo-hydrolase [Dehalococcoidia bacterium]|tara:strand:- start:1509 stop:2375 length:867 start_codon:yes stop_codon:yes gene_type:complete